MKHRPRPRPTALLWRGLLLAPLAGACSHDAGFVDVPDVARTERAEPTGNVPDVPDTRGDADVLDVLDAPGDGDASDVIDAPGDGDASDVIDAPGDGDASDVIDVPGDALDAPDVRGGSAPACPAGCSNCASGRCDDVATVSLGRDHACARMRDGTARCWGGGGMLTPEVPIDRPVPTVMLDPVNGLPFEHVEEVAVGYGQTCVRTGAGVGTPAGVTCWGNNAFGQSGYESDPPPPRIALPPTAEVAATFNHICARAVDGTVYCWGHNDLGQLGRGAADAARHPTPAPVPGLAGVAQVVVGGDYVRSFTCAIVGAERAVRCWGSNLDGQLGLGSADAAPHPTPAPVPGLTGVAALTAGENFVCARMDDGTARCWGARDDGRLGATPAAPASPTTVPGLTGVTRLVAGDAHVCALLADRRLVCWGLNAAGQLGGGAVAQPAPGARVTVDLAAVGDVADVAAGGANTCVIRPDGAPFCWGDNRLAQVADAASAARAPVAVVDVARAPLAGASAIAAGGERSCAVRGREALCWGSDGRWQATYAGEVRAAPVALGGRHVDALAIGDRHACALDRDDGSVRCWGGNDVLQLGEASVGVFRESIVGAPVVLTGATRVAAGDGHTCALLPAGVSCWGEGAVEQLGRGAEPPRARPEPVSVVATAGATEVAAGQRHTCVVLTNGDANCFGPAFPTPTAPAFRGVTRVALGGYHACALTAAGGVECRGGNAWGQLGAPPSGGSDTPRAVAGLVGVTRVTTGRGHTCAVQRGRVWCWGLNNFGQLGDGTLVDRWAPREVATPADAFDVAAGESHTCALLTDGAVTCWGRATNGQAGDGTPWQRSAPARVAFR